MHEKTKWSDGDPEDEPRPFFVGRATGMLTAGLALVVGIATVDAAIIVATDVNPIVQQAAVVRDSAGKLVVVYPMNGGYCGRTTSSDNGATWSAPIRTESFPNASVPWSLAIDQNNALYQGLIFNVGSFFNRSVDGGATWSEPVALHDGGWGAWDYQPSIVAEPAGVLHAVFYTAFGWDDPPFNLVYRRSPDGGLNWENEIALTSIPNEDDIGLGATAPFLCRNANGRLFVGYMQEVSGHNEAILLANDGSAWQAPARISSEGRASGALAMAVDSQGKVSIVWTERDGSLGNFRVQMRSYDPVAGAFGPVSTLTPGDVNAWNVAVGVCSGDVTYVAYDTYDESATTFGRVCTLSSQDSFGTPVQVSQQPGARKPSLRSGLNMNYPDRPDLLWTEPGAGGVLYLMYAIPGSAPEPPAITSALQDYALADTQYSYQTTASGSPTEFGATGLPDGLTANPSTGLISGKPTKTGEFTVNLSAKNAGGTGTAVLTLIVDKQVFYNGNDWWVENGPTAPTIFTLEAPHRITRGFTYHWNSGSGQVPGTIGFRATPGNVLHGPWQATGATGQGGAPSVYWWIKPGDVLAAGSYVVEDSDPATWSQNSGTSGTGMAVLYGYPSEPQKKPVIAEQPANCTVSAGDAVSFTVKATGTGVLTYQWYLNGTPIPGATDPTYTISSVASEHTGDYTVSVANEGGITPSAVATLTLIDLKVCAVLTLTGPVGTMYRIDYSTDPGDVKNWQTLTTVTIPSSPYVYIDWESSRAPKRFYRAIKQ